MRGTPAGFRSHAITTGAVLVAGLVWLVWQIGIAGGLPASHAYHVNALVPTAASLAPNSRVTMAGVEVGRVEDVQLRGSSALIELSITDRAVRHLPVDSKVAIRQHTPIGENYVSIDRGHARQTLPDNGTLGLSQAEEYVDVDQILSVLQGDTRIRARQMLQSVGGALDGRGKQLNQTLSGTSDALSSLSRVVLQIDDQGPRINRLVGQFASLSQAIGERGGAISVLSRRGKVAMQALARRDTSLRATLDELPATLSQVKQTSQDIERSTTRSGPVVSNLATAMLDLQPAVKALQPAATEGTGVLRELSSAVPPLQTTVSHLRSLSKPTQAAMPKLRKVLCQLNPALRYLKPYAPEVVGVMAGLGSSSNTYDAIGHTIRVVPVVTENAIVGLPENLSKTLRVLLNEGVLEKSHGLGWDPYPKAGSLRDTSGMLGVNGPSDYPRKYPRVVADC